MLMVKNKRNKTHFMETLRRFFEGGLPPPLPPPLDLRLGVDLVDDDARDSPRPPDKVGRSKPNNVGGCSATVYLNVKF